MTKILWINVSLIYIVGSKLRFIELSVLVTSLKELRLLLGILSGCPHVTDTRNTLSRQDLWATEQVSTPSLQNLQKEV